MSIMIIITTTTAGIIICKYWCKTRRNKQKITNANLQEGFIRQVRSSFRHDDDNA